MQTTPVSDISVHLSIIMIKRLPLKKPVKLHAWGTWLYRVHPAPFLYPTIILATLYSLGQGFGILSKWPESGFANVKVHCYTRTFTFVNPDSGHFDKMLKPRPEL